MSLPIPFFPIKDISVSLPLFRQLTPVKILQIQLPEFCNAYQIISNSPNNRHPLRKISRETLHLYICKKHTLFYTSPLFAPNLPKLLHILAPTNTNSSSKYPRCISPQWPKLSQLLWIIHIHTYTNLLNMISLHNFPPS